MNSFWCNALAPWRAWRWRYFPVVLIYFCFGASAVSGISETLWIKESLDLTAAQLAQVGVAAQAPWFLKMVIGQFVDSVPLAGSRRGSYLVLGAGVIATGMGLMAALASGWFPHWSPLVVLMLSATLASSGFMIQDVVADTMSTEVVPRTEEKNGKTQPRDPKKIRQDLAMVQVLGRLALIFAGVATAGLAGYLGAEFRETPQVVFWGLLALPALSLLSLFTLPKKSISPASRLDSWILLGGLAFVGLSIGGPMWWYQWPWGQEIVFAISLLVILLMLRRVLTDQSRPVVKTLAMILLALFVFRSAPTVGEGIRWWVFDELGFTPQWLGFMAQAGAIMSFLLLWLGAGAIARAPVRKVLLALIGLGVVFSFPEIAVYYGWNEAVNWSPRWVLFFDSALGSPLVHISMIPVLTIIAWSAPVQHRGTWFALASSLMNLALVGSRILTRHLNEWWVVSREIVDEAGVVITAADYSKLGELMLVVIGIGLVFPLVTVWLCLPKQGLQSAPK